MRDKDSVTGNHKWDEQVVKHVEGQLAAGIPISYMDDAYPGEIIQEHPDGRREIITFDEDGRQMIVRAIEARVPH